MATKFWDFKVLLQVALFKIVFVFNRPTFANDCSSHTGILQVLFQESVNKATRVILNSKC